MSRPTPKEIALWRSEEEWRLQMFAEADRRFEDPAYDYASINAIEVLLEIHFGHEKTRSPVTPLRTLCRIHGISTVHHVLSMFKTDGMTRYKLHATQRINLMQRVRQSNKSRHRKIETERFGLAVLSREKQGVSREHALTEAADEMQLVGQSPSSLEKRFREFKEGRKQRGFVGNLFLHPALVYLRSPEFSLKDLDGKPGPKPNSRKQKSDRKT